MKRIYIGLAIVGLLGAPILAGAQDCKITIPEKGHLSIVGCSVTSAKGPAFVPSKDGKLLTIGGVTIAATKSK